MGLLSRITLLCCLALLLWTPEASAGGFDGKALLLDTAVEEAPPIVNDNARSRPPVALGELLMFDLFIEDGEGLSIEGLSLAFENDEIQGDRFSFTSFFSVHSIEGLVGRAGPSRSALVSVFNSGGRTIGANGYIATVKLQALQDIVQGTSVRIESGRTQVIDARTGESDSVSVEAATFIVTNTQFDLSLDLDVTPGNQNRDLRFGIESSSNVEIEVHGNRIGSAVGFILEFVAQPGLTFDSFEAGDVFGDGRTLPADTTGASIVVTVADVAGPLVANSGFIGKMIFSPDDDFREARVSLVRGEMLRGGGFLFSGTGSVLVSTSIDFDESGETDFRDFLLFAAAFGTLSTQAGFDGRFDLNADGSVEFGDLVILSGIFENALGGNTAASGP
tara:strand:- start:6006 stop:7178 length:1173 start_codon:yes stop_codon:yes gene_type:complete